MVSFDAYFPAMSSAGLPGTAKKITNVTAHTIRMTSRLHSSRCASHAVMTASGGSRGAGVHSRGSPRAGIERVLHAVPDEIQAQHRQDDRDPGEHGDPPGHVVERDPLLDHVAPRGGGRLTSHAQER